MILHKIARLVERQAAKVQGKGWGSGTVLEEFRAAHRLLGKENVNLCIDVGGNKGRYTDAILKHSPSSQIVIFEPAKTNISHLQEKFGDYSNITVEPFALSDEQQTKVLYSNEEGSGLASLTERRLDHFGIDFSITEEVETLRFDDYWKNVLHEERIDILKIDVEGHELKVLQGSEEALKNTDVIQFEFGGCNIDTRTFFQDFWYFFAERDFDLFRITPFKVERLNAYRERDEFFSTTNYIALKRPIK